MFGKQDELEFILKWIFTCTHIPSQKEVERLITFFRQKKELYPGKLRKRRKPKAKTTHSTPNVEFFDIDTSQTLKSENQLIIVLIRSFHLRCS